MCSRSSANINETTSNIWEASFKFLEKATRSSRAGFFSLRMLLITADVNNSSTVIEDIIPGVATCKRVTRYNY